MPRDAQEVHLGEINTVTVAEVLHVKTLRAGKIADVAAAGSLHGPAVCGMRSFALGECIASND